MSIAALLNKMVDIKRSTPNPDGQGGSGNLTWATIYRRIPCRFNALTTNELAFIYDKQMVTANYVVYLEPADIRENDRLYLGSRIFDVKLIMNWDESDKYMKIAVLEANRNQ